MHLQIVCIINTGHKINQSFAFYDGIPKGYIAPAQISAEELADGSVENNWCS